MIELLAKYREPIKILSPDDLIFSSSVITRDQIYRAEGDGQGGYKIHKIPTISNSSVKLRNVLPRGKRVKITFSLFIISGGMFFKTSTPAVGSTTKTLYNTTGKHSYITNSAYDDIEISSQHQNNEWIMWDIAIEDETFTSLDINENESILLSKSLKDIKNPDKISGEYSKTFILPSSETNDRFFKGIKHYDHLETFNVRSKTPCCINQNGIYVTNGNLQLTGINDINGVKTYEMLFIGPSTSFFSNLKNKYLNNIDSTNISYKLDVLSDPETATPATSTGIVKSWTYVDGEAAKAANWPYVYSMVDSGHSFTKDYFRSWKNLDLSSTNVNPSQGLSLDDFTLHMYAWYLWDKIHTEFGYTYSGDIFSDSKFLNMAVPASSKMSRPYEDTLNSEISVTGEVKRVSLLKSPGDLYYAESNKPRLAAVFNHNNGTLTGTYNSNVYGHYEVSGRRSEYKYTYYAYMLPELNQRTRFNIKLQHKLRAPLTYAVATGGGKVIDNEEVYAEIRVYAEHWKPGTDGIYDETADDFKQETLVYTQALQLIPTDSVEWEEVSFQVPYSLLRNKSHYYTNRDVSKDSTDPDFYKTRGMNFRVQIANVSGGKMTMDDVLKFEVTANREDTIHEVTLGDTVSNPCQYLDDKTTYLDFFKTITNIFNLYTDVDEENKHIIYKSFDTFYGDGNTYDFTDKVLRNEEISKDYFSDVVYGKYSFNHDKGPDLYTKDYLERSKGISVGEYILETANEFTRNTSKISTKLLPSIARTLLFTNYFINICDYSTKWGERNKEIGFRINYPKRRRIANPGTSSRYALYMRFNLHWYSDYQVFVSEDIDQNDLFDFGGFSPLFGEPLYHYITWEYTDAYYSVETFWQSYLDMVTSNDSYLLTCKMKLSANDYSILKMNDTIIIENQKYYINNIKNFSPNGSTEMELIRVL